MVTPHYYKQFRCIGGECRHNCCRGGWEIEIDDEALSRFNSLSGELGERVRDAITSEGTFKNENGGCALLTPDGWCSLAQAGCEQCIVCDEYPRFTEYFEDYAERGISLSCEAAADIILNDTQPFSLVGESGDCTHPIFTLLFKARENIFAILQDRSRDIWCRLRLMLDYGRELQKRINENDYSPFTYEPSDTKDSEMDMSRLVLMLLDAEILYPQWRERLEILYDNEKGRTHHKLSDLEGERLALYFVYRYFLKGAFDCDPLSKLKLSALSIAAISALNTQFGDISECARLYSIEIEHDEDNLDMIYDELIFCEDFSFENIIRLLG